jgi:hypothetical protein
MAYFPNGSSGDKYLEEYCFRCVNWVDLGDDRDFGCPIWDLHTVHNYEQIKKDDFRRILDSFIPMDKEKVYPGQCLMFMQAVGEIKGQLHFEDLAILQPNTQAPHKPPTHHCSP